VREHALQLRREDAVTTAGECDPRYYLNDKTLRNISHRAIRGERLDRYDQPAVAKLIEMEKAANPDDGWFFRASGDATVFLLICQTATQRRMLELYGKVIVGMDATYKVKGGTEKRGRESVTVVIEECL
jgi:hypothetical protein